MLYLGNLMIDPEGSVRYLEGARIKVQGLLVLHMKRSDWRAPDRVASLRTYSRTTPAAERDLVRRPALFYNVEPISIPSLDPPSSRKPSTRDHLISQDTKISHISNSNNEIPPVLR